MAVSPQWKFELARSSDLERIGEITNASNRSIELVHNRAGSVSFKLPMSDRMASMIWPISQAIIAYRKNSEGEWSAIWSGYVWTVQEDISSNSMTVSAVGWLQRLEKRVLRRNKDYTGFKTGSTYWTDADIIEDLLAEANATTLTWDGSYVVPVVDDADPATPTLMGWGGATGDFSTHVRRYSIDKYAGILSEINKLTDLENGCDIRVDPLTRLVTVHAFKGSVKEDAYFNYGFGAENIQKISRQMDPTTVVNWLAAIGPSTLVPQYADTKLGPDPTTDPPNFGDNSQKSYGLLEEVASISDAKDSGILAVYAGGEVLIRSTPRVVYEFTPFPYTKDRGKGRIPEPLVDYDVGDVVYLTVKHPPRVDLRRKQQRVFGINITPDENGNEIIGSLTTSP